MNLSAFIRERGEKKKLPASRAVSSKIRSQCIPEKVYSNQTHANQDTHPQRLPFSSENCLIVTSDWCSVDSGYNNAAWSFSALSPRLSAKCLIACKQTFTRARDLLIKNSSGVKASAKYLLWEEKNCPTCYLESWEVLTACFLGLRIPDCTLSDQWVDLTGMLASEDRSGTEGRKNQPRS